MRYPMSRGRARDAPVTSILIAAYNADAFIARTIESAQAQSCVGIAIVVVEERY